MLCIAALQHISAASDLASTSRLYTPGAPGAREADSRADDLAIVEGTFLSCQMRVFVPSDTTGIDGNCDVDYHTKSVGSGFIRRKAR